MDKLHITQDDDGFWMLSLERGGEMSLLAHQFTAPEHLVENANELIATGRVKAAIVIDPPRTDSLDRQAQAAEDRPRPGPRKAGL